MRWAQLIISDVEFARKNRTTPREWFLQHVEIVPDSLSLSYCFSSINREVHPTHRDVSVHFGPLSIRPVKHDRQAPIELGRPRNIFQGRGLDRHTISQTNHQYSSVPAR